MGLIASDGCLSSNRKSTTFVSTDLDQIHNFLKALKIKSSIGLTYSGKGSVAYRVQVGDVNFYNFLESIGFTQAKSLTIRRISVPLKYFYHYLRGYFDGDGCTYSYFDPRWRSSFMFYISFACGSWDHLDWIQDILYALTNCKGHLTNWTRRKICYQLRYSKYESITILKQMYKNKGKFYLKRKYLKINDALAIVGRSI